MVCHVSLYAVHQRPVTHKLPADDLENALVNIAKKLGELGWSKSQVFDPRWKLQLHDIKLTRPGDS